MYTCHVSFTHALTALLFSAHRTHLFSIFFIKSLRFIEPIMIFSGHTLAPLSPCPSSSFPSCRRVTWHKLQLCMSGSIATSHVDAVMTGGGGPTKLVGCDEAAMIAAGECGDNVDEPMSRKKKSEEASQYK